MAPVEPLTVEGVPSQHLDDLPWLWSLARRPLAAVVADLEHWPAAHVPRACA